MKYLHGAEDSFTRKIFQFGNQASPRRQLSLKTVNNTQSSGTEQPFNHWLGINWKILHSDSPAASESVHYLGNFDFGRHIWMIIWEANWWNPWNFISQDGIETYERFRCAQRFMLISTTKRSSPTPIIKGFRHICASLSWGIYLAPCNPAASRNSSNIIRGNFSQTLTARKFL